MPLEDALREVAAGGGYGPWTWGCDAATGSAWFSDARKDAGEYDIAGIEYFGESLQALGLVLLGRR